MRLEHRVRTTATPVQVWSVLGDPTAWSTVVPLLRGLRGGRSRVTPGERLMALARLSLLAVPVDVMEVVRAERLVLVVHAAPGLREVLTFELVEAFPRGTEIRLTTAVEGAFAVSAVVPLWLVNGLTVRLLAAQTDRRVRLARRAAA